jgi:CTP synthase (UTP-ammonia lyase)
MKIALIGDYTPNATAHVAIPLALQLASGGDGCHWDWLHTSTLSGDLPPRLSAYDGVWCVPGSPYANARGALDAIRFARQTGCPFLGTCGGFQHALLEYAEAIWGVQDAAHAELDSQAPSPVIAPLACSLVEQTGQVRFVPGSMLTHIYGSSTAVEGYHCRYGLSPQYSDRLIDGALRISALDEQGDVRAVELADHPFYFATLFQPERAALAGRNHPLIAAFIAAAKDRYPTRDSRD